MARKQKFFGMRTSFGLEEVGDEMGLWGHETPPVGREHLVPPKKATYVFPRSTMSGMLLYFGLIGKGNVEPALAFKGPTGAGKTEFIKQVASRLNQPVQHMVFHEHLEYHELLGMQTIIDGETVYLPGPLVDAVRYGDWFLADEWELASSGTLTALNAVLDGHPLVIPENGGEVVVRHPNTKFFLTGNTGGTGDRTGLYSGTRPQNVALRNRCAWLEIDYLPEEVECAILERTCPDLPEFVRHRLVKAANAVRRSFIGRLVKPGDPDPLEQANGLSCVVSTRTLIAWADACFLMAPLSRQGIKPWERALEFVLLNGLDDPQEKFNCLEIVQRVMDDSEIPEVP